tara:strand:+ start:701 stop:2350 length:1650 start_codon:yes stop_codon:yes gene_type:complete
LFLFETKLHRAKRELASRVSNKFYQKDPIAWYCDKFGEDIKNLKWSEYHFYDGHVWDGTPDPFYQTFVSLAEKRWVGIESATSTGKTYMLPRILMWFLDVFPEASVITTAPKEGQLKNILWKEIGRAYPKFNRIRPHSELLTLRLKVDTRRAKEQFEDEVVYNLNVGHEAIGFVSGVGAGEESAVKMQGFHAENMLFVLDEMAGIHPAVLKAIINTSTGSNNLVIGMGNPDSQIDPLHEFCDLDKTDHIIISGYDHPNIVNKEKREIIPGAVSQQSIDLRESEYGKESPFFKSRVRGIAPTQGTDSLFRLEWLEKCLIDDEKFHGKKRRYGYDALAIDVAQSEAGDKASYGAGKSNEILYLDSFPCPNALHLAFNFMMENHDLDAKEYHNYDVIKVKDFNLYSHNIGVDSVGVGAATVDGFLEKGVEVIGLNGGQLEDAIPLDNEEKPLYQFNSLRAQMYWQLRIDLERNEVIVNLLSHPNYINIIKQLKKELVQIKYHIKSGKIGIESKDDIKKRLGGKSPDLLDAFVYWNWMRHNFYDNSGIGIVSA